MSRPELIDAAALKARLVAALRGEFPGSLYLLAIGALYLAAEPESPSEHAMWASLFDLQALLEQVNGSEVLAALAGVSS